MEVIHKDATITNTDDTGPGAFQVILSTGKKDRDGEEVLPEEWELPLPDHITFDVDHGMTVASTVGSGVPRIDENGRLVVDGTYSSLPRAQEVRTLVNEKHIRTTSVAFARERTAMKDGSTRTKRTLLNGAFVAIPANTDAVILSSKTAVKAGARNSKSDMGRIQSIHDETVALGATCDEPPSDAPDVDGKSVARATLPDLVQFLDTVDMDDLPASTKAAIDVIRGSSPTEEPTPPVDELEAIREYAKSFQPLDD